MAEASGITIAVFVAVFFIFVCCPAMLLLGCPIYLAIKSLCCSQSPSHQTSARHQRRRTNRPNTVTTQPEVEDTMNYRNSILFHDPPPTYDHRNEYPSVESPARTPHTARREIDDLLPPGQHWGPFFEQEELEPPPDYSSQVIDLEVSRTCINGDSISQRNQSGMLDTVMESELTPPPDYTSQVLSMDIGVPTTSRDVDEELRLHDTILEDEPPSSDNESSQTENLEES